jgi:hypothetical protein
LLCHSYRLVGGAIKVKGVAYNDYIAVYLFKFFWYQ